jgi:hypothetical protein
MVIGYLAPDPIAETLTKQALLSAPIGFLDSTRGTLLSWLNNEANSSCGVR